MAFLDKAGLERLWAHIVSLVGTKVEKVEGKGLSTEDFTTEEKEKLANITDYVDEAIANIDVVTSWNDLTDKPFYEVVEENVLVAKRTISGFTVMEDPIYVVQNAFTMSPIVGQTYRVNWDGVDYDVVMQESDGLGYMGNENYVFSMTSGGNIPFAIIFGGGGIFVATESTNSFHTISISAVGAVVHYLDSKYIKDMYHEELNDAEVIVEDLTYSQYNDIDLAYNLIPNAIYDVIWNGEKYAEQICYYIGVFNTIGDDNTPFRIEEYDGQNLNIYSNDGSEDWVITIIDTGKRIVRMPSKYLPSDVVTQDNIQGFLDNKMNTSDPHGSGGFSMNRKKNSYYGLDSVTLGGQAIAIGNYSVAEGYNTAALGTYALAEGKGYIDEVYVTGDVKATTYTINSSKPPSSNAIYKEPYGFAINGNYKAKIEYIDYSTGELRLSNTISNFYALNNEPIFIIASGAMGESAHSEGNNTMACGNQSHSEGYRTIASSDNQHVQGKYNIEDVEGKYAHIVGNGDNDVQSNAHTLDWQGNAWYQGDVFVGGTSQDDASILATEQYVDEALANIDIATSWNDLEDRPFYTESATLLQENSLTVTKETYYNYYSYVYEGEAIPFIPVAGTTYTIVFNDTTYTCVGKLSGDNPYIGNDVKNNVFVSDQEPFQIYYSHYWNSLTISTKALGPHSIAVTANEIHKIEEKYLPDNLARTDVVQDITAENTFTVSPIIPVPTEGDHAANKDYVDAQIDTSVAAAIDGKLMMVEYTPYSNGTSELSHTFEEIYNAAIANKIIVFRRAGGWQHYIMTEYSTHAVHFSLVSSADANLGAPIMACVVIDENNTVTESTYSTVRLSRNIGVLPGQTIKVKSLINGLPAEWEAVDLLSADHTHDVEDITDGVLSVAQGGTGQTSIVDTTYTAPRYRASALVTTETNPTSNGVITWIYE